MLVRTALSLSLLTVLACQKGAPPPASPVSGLAAEPAPPHGLRCARDAECPASLACAAGRCVERPAAPGPDANQDAGKAAPAVPFGGPVPMFRMDPQHTGRSPFLAPQRRPREQWRYETGGAIFAAPAVAEDGTIVFGSHDRHVYALLPSGTLRWKHTTADLVWTSPALVAGVIYVGSDDDHVYALGLSDGAPRWALAPGKCRRTVGIGPETARCDVDQITLGHDGTIYVGGDAIYALRPDGSVRWRFSPGARVHCAAAPAVSRDGVVYAGCQDDGLYAINPDGSKRWEFRAQDDLDSSPSLGPDGTVYVGSDDRRLYALSPDGKLRFALLTEGAVRGSPAVGTDGTVYAGSYDGLLYAVRPDGTVSWTFRCADRIHSSPLIDASGAVIFGSQDDRLYALDAGGTQRWSVLLGGDVDSSPVLGPDGTIYVGADDGVLYALR